MKTKKKEFKNIVLIFIMFFFLLVMIGFISGCHETTKNFGGSMTVKLDPGMKLEEITWKDTDLWLLTRPFREGEEPETHTFYEDSEWGVMEGTVTIVESEE